MSSNLDAAVASNGVETPLRECNGAHDKINNSPHAAVPVIHERRNNHFPLRHLNWAPSQQNTAGCQQDNGHNAEGTRHQNQNVSKAVKAQSGKPFKQRRSFEERKREVDKISSKFPGKIPVVVERYQREMSLPAMDKSKFLVPQDLTMMDFAVIIKNRLQVPTYRAFYFIVNNQSMPSTSRTIAEIYREQRDEDGFLYMTYASQEMFGC